MRRVRNMLILVRNRLRCLWNEWFGTLATRSLLLWKIKHDREATSNWSRQMLRMCEYQILGADCVRWDVSKWHCLIAPWNCLTWIPECQPVNWGTAFIWVRVGVPFHWRTTPFGTTPAATPCFWSARKVMWVDKRRMGERAEPYQWVLGGHRHNTGIVKWTACFREGGGGVSLRVDKPLSFGWMNDGDVFSGIITHWSHNLNICLLGLINLRKFMVEITNVTGVCVCSCILPIIMRDLSSRMLKLAV